MSLLKPSEAQVIGYVKTIKPFNSSAWRITVIFSTLVTLIIGALLFNMYQQVVTEQRNQIQQHLHTEKLRYQQLALSVDRVGFAAQVHAADPKSAFIVWRNGNKVEGALSFMPEDMPMLPKTQEFPILAGGPEKIHLLTGGIAITRYGPVLIATRSDHLSTLFDHFTSAAAAAVMFTLVMTLILGYLFSKAILRRLVHYNRLSEQIEHGRYDVRFPIDRREDEFDMLAHQFNHVLDTLEKNLTAVRGVTDNIAHDLRTPLSHIRMGLETLPAKPAAEVPEACAILMEELDHCLATFDAMLSLTRIEEGQQKLDLKHFSLQEICTDLLEMAEVLAEMNEQTLTLEMGEDYQLTGDKYLLFQAIFNLVDNAIKYSGKQAHIEIVQSGGMIQIKDNGPGIPKDCYDKVFERLVRLDPSRHHQGTGLGLSMVKAILSRHNAHIHMSDNRPGLVVTITF